MVPCAAVISSVELRCVVCNRRNRSPSFQHKVSAVSIKRDIAAGINTQIRRRFNVIVDVSAVAVIALPVRLIAPSLSAVKVSPPKVIAPLFAVVDAVSASTFNRTSAVTAVVVSNREVRICDAGITRQQRRRCVGHYHHQTLSAVGQITVSRNCTTDSRRFRVS